MSHRQTELITIAAPAPRSVAQWIAHSAVMHRLTLGGFIRHPEMLAPELVLQVMDALGAPGSVRTVRAAVSSDPNADLNQIECPTLIIGGAHDPLPPDADVERSDSVPTATAVALRNTGHWPHLERPVAFLDELTAFLDI